MIGCREATFLMAKKEEGKLSIIERIKLAIHSSMCAVCKNFEKQTGRIGEESKHVHADDDLPVSTKAKIEHMLNDYTP